MLTATLRAPEVPRLERELLEPVPGLRVARWGHGRRVFLGLHGWSGSHRTFDPLLPHLPADATLYAIDQPGFGGSAPPAAWDLRAFLAPIREAVERLGLEDVTLVGSCGGAVIGLDLALALGGRVGRMVLIDPFAYVPWYFAMLTWRGLGRLFYLSTFANPLGRWIANLSLSARRAHDTSLTEGFERVRHREAHAYLRLLCAPRRLEAYRAIEAEVALVHGARTFGAVKRSIALFRELWPRSQVHALAGAGHLPIQEAPASLAAVVFGSTRREGAARW